MAFLDNSGDIILDAVLTDTGRFRLAKGDASFRVAKFAFGDDEINYENYDKKDTRGSAYYDLDILQTPVLEAFTNNTSMMNSKLITIPRTNLLYLPIIRLNTLLTNTKQAKASSTANDSFVISVDDTTSKAFSDSDNNVLEIAGYIQGNNLIAASNFIRVDQGLHTQEIPVSFALDPDLKETNYIIQMDHRLGSLASVGGSVKNPRFIDDDNIAHYYLSQGVDSNIIYDISANDPGDADAEATMAIAGPRGTKLEFAVAPSLELASSSFLFGELGTSGWTMVLDGADVTDLQYIDSVIKVQGATTGYSMDIAVRFIKK
jgi:hypothetical protein